MSFTVPVPLTVMVHRVRLFWNCAVLHRYDSTCFCLFFFTKKNDDNQRWGGEGNPYVHDLLIMKIRHPSYSSTFLLILFRQIIKRRGKSEKLPENITQPMLYKTIWKCNKRKRFAISSFSFSLNTVPNARPSGTKKSDWRVSLHLLIFNKLISKEHTERKKGYKSSEKIFGCVNDPNLIIQSNWR